MFSIKNGINATINLQTGSHKNFPILCGKFLKRILTYLFCINSNEINIRHLYMHKNVFHNI